MGLSNYAKQAALDAIVPAAGTYYVALFTTVPDDTGAGGIEASGSGYARVAHSPWLDETDTAAVYKKNSGNVAFAALTAALLNINGWGLFDALTAGNLIAFGDAEDVGGNIVTLNFNSGDIVQFQDQTLKFGIGAAS